MFEFAASHLTKLMSIGACIVAVIHVLVEPSVFTTFALLGWVLAVLLSYVNAIREEQVATLVDALEERGYEVEID